MRWLATAWLGLGLLGCAGGRSAGSLEPLRPEAAVGISRQVEVRVLEVTFVREGEGPDAALFAELEVVVDNVDAGVARGSGVQRSGFAMGRDSLVLVGDGVRYVPEAVDGKPGWYPAAVDVPPDGASMRRGKLRYKLPNGSPASLSLEALTPGVALRIPLSGAATDADGKPIRPLYVLGADGRPIDKDVAVTVGGAPLARAEGEGAWLLPAGTRSASVTAAGFEAAEVAAPAGDAPVLVRLRPEAAKAPWARALDWPTLDHPIDVDALSAELDSVEEIAAYVRGLGVLPTTGLQRSPSATIARGAGGPVDRAELARALLARAGVQAQLVCGDLTDEDARVVFARTAPAVAPFAAPARAATEALVRDTAPGLEKAGTPRQSARDRLPLRPEWCDVLIQKDGTFEPLDLRPASIAGSPRPFAWRALPKVDDQLWRVSLAFKAVVRDGPDRWKDVPLLRYDTDAPTLSEKGMLFDLYMDEVEGRPGLRPMLAVIDRRGLGGQVGTGVTFEGLDRVMLDVSWRDPLNVEETERSVTLWERQGADAVVTSLRALVSGDADHASLDRASTRAAEAFLGRWQLPGAEVLQADQELLGLLVGAGRGGLEPTAPPVRVTVLHEEAGGKRWRRTEEAMATGPAIYGAPPTFDDRVTMGASLVSAVDLFGALGGRPAPGALPPVAWASSVDGLLQLSFRDSQLQMRARREVEAGVWVGVQGADRVWRFDPASGGTSLFGAPVPLRHYAGEPAQPQGAAGAHARWEIVAMCEAIPRWRAVLGVTGVDPAACAEQVR